MKKSVINDLVALSDFLDETGLKVEADNIDDIIKFASSSSHSVMAFVDALKRELARSEIDPGVMSNVVGVIDSTLESESFQEPAANSENFQMWKDVRDPAVELAESIMALRDDIERADERLSQKTQWFNPEGEDDILRGREVDIGRLQKRIEQLQRMESGAGRQGDVERAARVREILKERGRA